MGSTSRWWLLGASVASAVAFGACGSEVSETPAPGGAGGAGSTSATTSTGTTTTATTTGSGPATTSTTATTTSTGSGGNACDQACDKLAVDCGFGEVCGLIPFLDCNDPASECPGQCILDASCADIAALVQQQPAPDLTACLGACQGGSGAGGGGSQDCQNCTLQQCGGEVQTCFGDQDCGAWLQCAGGCPDAACIADCNAQHPSSAALWGAVLACDCASCATECAAGDPCNVGGSGGGGAGGGGQGGAGGG